MTQQQSDVLELSDDETDSDKWVTKVCFCLLSN